eukprot:COSAG01_NODE_6213_length_3791_cov_2.926598_1_plen_122_part_10
MEFITSGTRQLQRGGGGGSSSLLLLPLLPLPMLPGLLGTPCASTAPIPPLPTGPSLVLVRRLPDDDARREAARLCLCCAATRERRPSMPGGCVLVLAMGEPPPRLHSRALSMPVPLAGGPAA